MTFLGEAIFSQCQWERCLGVCIHQPLLLRLPLLENNHLEDRAEDPEMVSTAKEKVKELERLFAGYDRTQAYPFEVVDKGGMVGQELS